MISAPQRDEHTAARRRGLVGLLPLIVLAACLLIVLAVVAAEPGITFTRLRAFVGFLSLPKPVGSFWEGFNFPSIDPFSPGIEHRSWLETVVFDVVYLASTTALGSPVVRAIRGDDEWPRAVQILAGFLPGYLMVIAPLELLFDAVPLRTASWIGLAALPTAAIALHWRALVAGARGLRRGLPRRDGAVLAASLATVFVLVAMVHRLQQGFFYLTQDSIAYYLHMGMSMIDGRTDYLIHWQSQTDEWIYNAPLMFSHTGYGDLWWSFYVTQSAGVAAFLCLLYGVVHRVARRRKVLAGTLALSVVFGSTLSIYPWVYAWTVVGGQPVFALGHPGRLIGIIGPWAALLIMLTPRRPPLWALALVTLGLAFTNLNNVLYVGVAIAAAVIWRLSRGRVGVLGSKASRFAVHGTLALTVVLPTAAFSFTRGVPSSPIVPATMLLAACVAGVVGAAVIAWGTIKTGRPGSVPRLLAWSAAWGATALVGVLLSDNVGTTSIGQSAHSALSSIFPAFDEPVAFRADLPDGVFSGLSFPTFAQGACEFMEPCGGLAFFLLCYGVLFSLAVAVWVGYGRLRSDAERANERRVALLLGLALLSAVLILVFFAGAETRQAATFTRMLEWPSYSLLVLAVLGFCEARDRRVSAGGVAFLAIWTIVPLLSFEWPLQMMRNAGWYLDRLL